MSKINLTLYMVANRNLYETYHASRKLQKRVINEKNFTYRPLLPILEKYSKGSEAVLDIGCGVGTIAFYLASKGKNVTGVDISINALDVAKLNAKLFRLEKRIEFVLGDFMGAKINGKFDLIVCLEVLEHLGNDELVVGKINDLLRDGGIAIVAVPSKNSLIYKLGLAKNFDREVGHLRRYTAESLSLLLLRAGLKAIYLKKFEGILRNYLFTYSLLGFFIRAANRFNIFSDILTFFDNITLRLLGEAQIVVVAKKIKRRNDYSVRRKIRRR